MQCNIPRGHPTNSRKVEGPPRRKLTSAKDPPRTSRKSQKKHPRGNKKPREHPKWK